MAEADPSQVTGRLLPEEIACTHKMNGKRLAEFTAGRLLARELLSAMGRPAQPLLNDEDRAPIWPPGVVGSITHTLGFCGVAVSRAAAIRALGLDVEQATDLKTGLFDRICTQAERTWLEGRPEPERGLLAKLLFSAKECAYKCQYPLTRRFLGFKDVQVDLDLEQQVFMAFIPGLMQHDLIPEGMIPGRFSIAAGLVLTGSFLGPG